MGRTLRDIVREREEVTTGVPRDHFAWARSWLFRYLLTLSSYPALLALLQRFPQHGDAPIFAAVIVLPILQIVAGTLWVVRARWRREGKKPWLMPFAVPITIVMFDALVLVGWAIIDSRGMRGLG